MSRAGGATPFGSDPDPALPWQLNRPDPVFVFAKTAADRDNALIQNFFTRLRDLPCREMGPGMTKKLVQMITDKS